MLVMVLCLYCSEPGAHPPTRLATGMMMIRVMMKYEARLTTHARGTLAQASRNCQLLAVQLAI